MKIKHLYVFGPFRLNVTEKLFLRDEETLPLTPKAFETLLALVQKSGQLVAKDELLREIWPDSFVAESSLTQNIYQIRKTLGQDAHENTYIETIPRRGYRFRAAVREIYDEGPAQETPHNGNGAPTAGAVLPSFALATPPEHIWSAKDELPAASRPAWQRRGWLGLSLLVLLLLAVGGGQWWRASQRAAPRPKSLAILPFQTVGLNANEELLGLGMADALIIKLSGQQQLSVLPTSAVIKYTGQGREALSIGRSLGVESVLDGTIQRAGERVRVTLQILRVSDGQTLWTGQFDEPFTGIFAVQDAVAARISQSLALQLAHGGPTRQANTYTTNTEAYQAYLTGRFFYEKRGPEDLAQAINYLQQAVKLDPNFALGYATLADCYYLQTYYGYGKMPVSETSARVNELAQQALQLDANLAEAHIARAGVKISFEHNVPGAQAELQQALALNPSSMLAHLRYAWTLYAQGRIAETVREMRAAQELDPLSPTPNIALSSVLIMAREADEAVKYARQAVAIAPESYPAHLALGDALVIKGQFEAGINEYLGVQGKAPNQEISATIVMSLAYAYAVAKRPSEARRYLAQMHGLAKNDYPVPPYQFAIIYAALGDHDTAFAWLEKIPESRVRPAMLRLDPQLDILRGDPRFAALLEKYKLP